jgi:hypothetical protein
VVVEPLLKRPALGSDVVRVSTLHCGCGPLGSHAGPRYLAARGGRDGISAILPWLWADLSGRDLAWLERRRAELFALISRSGLPAGRALNVVWRKCGKPTRSLTVLLCTVRIEYPAARLWPGVRSRPSSGCWLVYRTCELSELTIRMFMHCPACSLTAKLTRPCFGNDCRTAILRR